MGVRIINKSLQSPKGRTPAPFPLGELGKRGDEKAIGAQIFRRPQTLSHILEPLPFGQKRQISRQRQRAIVPTKDFLADSPLNEGVSQVTRRGILGKGKSPRIGLLDLVGWVLGRGKNLEPTNKTEAVSPRKTCEKGTDARQVGRKRTA